MRPTAPQSNDHTAAHVYRDYVEAPMLAGMSAVEAAGAAPPLPTRPPAICFVDLSKYTALTEQIGDQAAAERVGRLGTLLQELAHSHGGSVVKLLGDGAMLQFPDPAGRRRNWPYDTRPRRSAGAAGPARR